jgi:uncharacterized FlaG/YvyC family protein
MVEEGDSIDSIGAVDPIGAIGVSPTSSHATPTAAAPKRQTSAQDIQNSVNKVNAHLSSVSRVLELTVDAGSGLTVATIKDSQTGAVLQQFPSVDSLHLAEMLADWAGDKSALLNLIA